MKRIFFLLYSMGVGGVEKALLGLLSKIPLDSYEVHVGLIKNDGSFLDFLPKEVTVHEINCYKKYWRLINDPPLRSFRRMLKQGHVKEAIVCAFYYLHSKLTSNRLVFYKYILRKEPMFPGFFDLAVAFAGPSLMIDYFIYSKVRAAKKCGWIHFDVSKIGIDEKMTAQMYEEFDKIFVVSEAGKEIFDCRFPQFAFKTEVFHNVVSHEQILNMAEVGPSFEDNFDGKRILTVGRISLEKGQRVAIEALKSLLDKGFKLKWYFVGDGIDRSCCEQLVADFGIVDNVVFLGTQLNPYGYMKNCDLYVQPSRHEGYCITLAEALCFNNPIVSTDFTGAAEQLCNRENGVVTGMSVEDLVAGVIEGLKKGTLVGLQNHKENDISSFFDLLR